MLAKDGFKKFMSQMPQKKSITEPMGKMWDEVWTKIKGK